METTLIPTIERYTVKRNISRDEVAIRAVIDGKEHLWSYAKLSRYANEKMERKAGRMISAARMGRIVRGVLKENEESFNDIFLSGRKAAFESYQQYKRLGDEAWRLFDEAYEIEHMVEEAEKERIMKGEVPEGMKAGRLKAREKMIEIQSMAMDKIRQATEAKDKMLKMAGTYQERAPSEQGITEQIKLLQSAFMTYMQYIMICPNCGQQGEYPIEHFIEFIEAVSKDPDMLNVYLKRTAGKRMAYQEFGKQAKEMLYTDEEKEIDAEYDELMENKDDNS